MDVGFGREVWLRGPNKRRPTTRSSAAAIDAGLTPLGLATSISSRCLFDRQPGIADDAQRRLTPDVLLQCIQRRHRQPHSYRFRLSNPAAYRGRVPHVRLLSHQSSHISHRIYIYISLSLSLSSWASTSTKTPTAIQICFNRQRLTPLSFSAIIVLYVILI
jgi:hypothetical protein